MVKAGLTPAQALTAATSGAADCMKVAGQLGALVPGAWADFVVLDKNPLEDIRNARTIASVWVAGAALPRPCRHARLRPMVDPVERKRYFRSAESAGRLPFVAQTLVPHL